MSREAIVGRLNEEMRQWVEDLFRENEGLRDALEICVNWILDVRRAAQNPETAWLSSPSLIEGATKTLEAQLAARGGDGEKEPAHPVSGRHSEVDVDSEVAVAVREGDE